MPNFISPKSTHFKILLGLTALTAVVFVFSKPAYSVIDKYIRGLGESYKTAIYTNVKSNLQQIFLCQTAYHKNNGGYINCPPNPGKIPHEEPLMWETGARYNSWKKLGFELKGKVHYQYMVTNADKNGFRAVARSRKSGSGNYHVLTITEKGVITETNTPKRHF